jgi:hypothetical protein
MDSGERQKTQVVFAITTLVVSLLLALVMAEIVLRFTIHARLANVSFEPHEYYTESPVGYDIKPNLGPMTHRFADFSYPIWSNSLGCFDDEYKGEEPYIFLTGDSFTWGYTEFENKWGTLLEGYLGQRVLKCGVSGYGTRQQLHKAETTLSHIQTPPALVVVGYFEFNDATDDANFPNYIMYKGERVSNPGVDDPVERERRINHMRSYCLSEEPEHPFLQRIKCYLGRHSALYAALKAVAKEWIPAGLLQSVGMVNAPVTQVSDEAPREANFSTLLDFQAFAKRSNTELLFVIIPRKGTESGETSGNSQVSSFMNEHGIRYYDPLEDFRAVSRATRTPLFWELDAHLNTEGNRLLGLLVARKILLDRGEESSTQMTHVENELRKKFSYTIPEDHQ